MGFRNVRGLHQRQHVSVLSVHKRRRLSPTAMENILKTRLYRVPSTEHQATFFFVVMKAKHFAVFIVSMLLFLWSPFRCSCFAYYYIQVHMCNPTIVPKYPIFHSFFLRFFFSFYHYEKWTNEDRISYSANDKNRTRLLATCPRRGRPLPPMLVECHTGRGGEGPQGQQKARAQVDPITRILCVSDTAQALFC